MSGEVAVTAAVNLDLACHSARDFLALIHAVRETKPRDGLRALEDALLDLVGE
jgi:hypothetical protein